MPTMLLYVFVFWVSGRTGQSACGCDRFFEHVFVPFHCRCVSVFVLLHCHCVNVFVLFDRYFVSICLCFFTVTV